MAFKKADPKDEEKGKPFPKKGKGKVPPKKGKVPPKGK